MGSDVNDHESHLPFKKIILFNQLVWRGPLGRLLDSERASKAQRFALSIGADADHDVLRAFLHDPEGRVFEAHEAREIRKFFQWVTMSVTARSRSAAPNQTVDVAPLDLDDYGDF